MSKYIDADRFRSAMRYSFGESDSYIERGMAKWDSGLWLRYKAVEEVLDAQPAVALAPVKEHDSDHIWYNGKQFISLRRVGEMIKEKTADVAPVKRGMWRVTHELESWDIVYCSECGEGMWNKNGDKLPNYCYNCGAKMFDKDIDVPDKNVGKMDEAEE